MSFITTNNSADMERDYLFASAMTTAEGRQVLAQVMVEPIKNALNYQAIGRKLVTVDELPQGVLPRYEKDVPGFAYTISKHGAVPDQLIEAQEVFVPTFIIASNPQVPITEISSRRFFIVDRAQMKAKEAIQKDEDTHVLAAIETATLADHVVTPTGAIELADVTEAFAYIAEHDLTAARIVMHPDEYYKDLIMWQNTDVFDQATKRDVLMSGLFGHLLTADVHVSHLVPKGSVYVLAPQDYVGVMPVRQDISIIPADEPTHLRLGWVVFEEIGVGIMNDYAIAKIEKAAAS